MSYALLPPEVNSGLVYAGPGSASLQAAATAWQGMSTDMTTSAGSVSHVVTGMAGQWEGPSYTTFVNATTPYITWMHATAALATQMGAHAATAAGLYETVHAAVVTPALIATNRATLLTLIATNLLGQNAALIAANEAEYQTMWATDAAAMEAYDTASQANNTALQQPAPAPQTSNAPSQPVSNAQAPSTQATSTQAASTQATQQAPSLAAGDPTSTTPATTTPATTTTTGASSSLSGLQALYYPLLMATLPLRVLLSMMMQMARGGAMGGAGLAGASAGATGTGTLMTQIGDFVNDKLQGAVGTLAGHFSTATNAISAKLGQAASMGALKVPQAWAAAADGMMRAAPVLPNTTVSAPVQTMSASGLPGGPFGNAMMGAMAGRGLGAVAAKAPKVMPRSPAGG